MSEADPSDPLIAAELSATLGECRLGNQIVVVEEAGSTNDIVWEAVERGAAEGFVVFAERQTAGRGQYGRRWESSSRQGLWFSILLRPSITLQESPRLTSLLATATATAIIAETGCAASIKAPNDIYVSGRKVAGVLVEGRTTSNRNYVAVAGLGVNVNQMLDDFPVELQQTAGSLRMAAGHPIRRAQLAIALLRKLEAEYRDFTQAG